MELACSMDFLLADAGFSVSNACMRAIPHLSYVRLSQFSILLGLCQLAAVHAETVTLQGRPFQVLDGYQLEVAVAPELTLRPIVVDLDTSGNLYVAESSGTNAPVATQLDNKPHSILKLSDSNGDGTYDRRTVFADEMMFPEGAMWHDGSLYVSAPPQIWKLTDSDSDGVADRREIWFDAKTLTGCANDLHGPYLGPDGWIYWCKGAFAEQTYERPGRKPLVSRAAHIFRRRPEGGPVEAVMTGGMDNPVEVAFSSAGERFFTTTFFQHPANGRRDGLVHAVYGGVYGKPHGVLDRHPRTGDLMPVMTHLGAAAPSGLARVESHALGLSGHLVSACFNLHNVQTHRLIASGATFKTQDQVLVESDDIDFHPTDVIEDADGSLLIVDTGGWYKLCCPTSQLHKPDALGNIYRLTKRGRHSVNVADARGSGIAWQTAKTSYLAELLGDARPTVRQRAIDELSRRGTAAIETLEQVLVASQQTQNGGVVATVHESERGLGALWAACRIEHDSARKLIRDALDHPDDSIQQAALHAVSVWRDDRAKQDVEAIIQQNTNPATLRAAAEALGRIGNAESVRHLLAALGSDHVSDRVLEHSLIYAAIEIGEPAPLIAALRNPSRNIQYGALTAIVALPDVVLPVGEVRRLLTSEGSDGSKAEKIALLAAQLVNATPQHGEAFAAAIRTRKHNQSTARLAGSMAAIPAVRDLVSTWFSDETMDEEFLTLLVSELPAQALSPPQDASWSSLLLELLDREYDHAAETMLRRTMENNVSLTFDVMDRLAKIAASPASQSAMRLIAARQLRSLDSPTFEFVLQQLGPEASVELRSEAAVTIANTTLTSDQLFALADAQQNVGPLELSQTLDVFQKQTEPELGRRLFVALAKNPAARGIPARRLQQLAQPFGADIVSLAKPLWEANEVTDEEKRLHLEELLANLPSGEIHRGHEVFHSKAAACFACHALGYRGGRVGPDLSRIGRVRTRQDLLEAIIYPSASLVRSYEPFLVVTKDGVQHTGILADQAADRIVLQCNATERNVLHRDEIDSIVPSSVSIMPAGIDKQLSRQQLADLMAFLESRK